MKDTYADGNQPVADSADLGAPRTVHADSRDPQSSSSLATLRRQHVVINGAEIVHRPAFCESGMCAACEINRLRALVDDSTQREADLQLAFNASNDHVGKLIADLTALRASLRAQEPQQNEIQEEKATRVDHTQYPSKPLATAATNEPVPTKKYRSCALRPDAQAFDEIRIVTVPRYKTSGLSGDEWRISAETQFYRKGALIFSEYCRNVETACRFLAYWHAAACDDAKGYFAGDGVTCDQEGCSARATVRHRRLFDYCHAGHKSVPSDVSLYRHFCEQHKTRGDCAFDDADANYVQEPLESLAEVIRLSASPSEKK